MTYIVTLSIRTIKMKRIIWAVVAVIREVIVNFDLVVMKMIMEMIVIIMKDQEIVIEIVIMIMIMTIAIEGESEKF